LRRTLYIFEFIIGFAPCVFVLAIGVIFSPVMLVGLFSGALATALYLLWVAAGMFGFWGAMALLTETLEPNRENTSPNRVRFYLCCGVIACGMACYAASHNIYLFFVAFNPLVVTLHLAIIQRDYLCVKSS